MDWFHRGFLALLLTIGLAEPAFAQDHRPAAPQAASSVEAPRKLTGKERLGPKWTDEQRLDNCNVPPDKRGTRPRPDGCENIPSN
jgi:hypothetical protein